MATSYLVVASARPGIVQTVDPPRQLLLAASIAAAVGYAFLATRTSCRPGDPIPADAVPFGGFVDASMSATGGVSVVASGAQAISLRGDPGPVGPEGPAGPTGSVGPSALVYAGYGVTDVAGTCSVTWPRRLPAKPVCVVQPAALDGYVYQIGWTATVTGLSVLVTRARLNAGIAGAYVAPPPGTTLSILAFGSYS